MINVTAATSRAFNRLDVATQAKVRAIVRAHLWACVNTGAPIENLDRLFVEAIEIVKLNFKEEQYEPYEPFRRYLQYQSPRV